MHAEHNVKNSAQSCTRREVETSRKMPLAEGQRPGEMWVDGGSGSNNHSLDLDVFP